MSLADPAADLEGFSASGLDRIDDLLKGAIADGEIAGVAWQVARHGRIVRKAWHGLKDIAAGEPVAEDTLFRIYSMTKPVTAVAMMILHDQGLWRPEDPIAKHLPEFADVKGPGGVAVEHAPTMGELMTHTAGFGYGIGPGPHDPADKALIEAGIWQADSLAEFSRRVAGVPLAYQPGATFRYSLSMDLQGAIIERLTGESLPDFMAKRIFQPLGMVDTGFFVPEAKLPRLATVYHKYGFPTLTVLDMPGFIRDPKLAPPIPSGGGGLYATLADYGRFAQMLLNKGQVKGGELDGARIISPEAFAQMTSNHLSQAIIDQRPMNGFQRILPGRGYGYNGAVYYDPALAEMPVGRGTYQWDGAAGVWFWIDPENDIAFVGMIQRMLQEGMPRLQELTQKLVAQALK